MRHLRILLSTAALAGALPASAAELDFEGFYRARARAFNSLSLNRSAELAEGTQAWVQHRVWLRPRVLIDEHAAVFIDFRALDGVYWGDTPVSPTNVTGAPVFDALEDGLAGPTTADGGVTPQTLTLWRAWGEAHLGNTHFKVGRMPVHWGAGIWQNDGLGLDADFGDTVDRAQVEVRFADAVYTSVAVDLHTEGYVNATDDLTVFSGIVGYLTETVDAGLYMQYRTSPARNLGIFSADLAASARIGNLSVDLEGIAFFGKGDIGGDLDDVRIASGGGVIDVGLKPKPLRLGVEGGFGSGDRDLSDQAVHTFTFDRDFDVALMMFEQPMPRLQAVIPSETNGGLSYDEVLTGNAMSNVLYLRPTVGYELRDDLAADVMLIMARTAALPDSAGDRAGYGIEVDGRVTWEPTEHIQAAGTMGVFVPGKFYRNAESDLDFNQASFGFELNTRIRF